MTVPAPHFLLFSEASEAAENRSDAGRWRFVLEAIDGTQSLEAADDECETSAERLELLAIVRGLEALDQPSRVTLVTRNRNISRGLRYGLEQWRENDWQWERFGQMTPVKNGDLWKRIDQALLIHQVECRAWKLDTTSDLAEVATSTAAATDSVWRKSANGKSLRIDSPRTADRPIAGRPVRRADYQAAWKRLFESLQHRLANLSPIYGERSFSR
jgi:ribonuclease HI